MEICFEVEGFIVKVSTHGSWGIYTPKMPLVKPSQIHDGEVYELGFEILENDDINVDLEDEALEAACRQYIRRHLAELQAKEIVALALWEEIKNRPPLTGFGDAVKIGDQVTVITKGLGKKEDIQNVEIIYLDENEVVFKYLDPSTGPFHWYTGLVEGCLQGPGWKRYFTKIEK